MATADRLDIREAAMRNVVLDAAAGEHRPGRAAQAKDTGAIAAVPAREKLMADWGLQATPALAWRDAAGLVQMRTGAPPEVLAEVFGPR